MRRNWTPPALSVAVLFGALSLAPVGLSFDRHPFVLHGVKTDKWAQSTTGAERQLRERFRGISDVYCVGAKIPRDGLSSFVHGTTRYWDKLACAGTTYTTGQTRFSLVFDAKGPKSWTMYRLTQVSVADLKRLKPKPTPAKPASTPRSNCDPSYVGACLDPNASDYDCAGGSGDGPLYTGPVRVVGPDHFGLDRDGDGYACESS